MKVDAARLDRLQIIDEVRQADGRVVLGLGRDRGGGKDARGLLAGAGAERCHAAKAGRLIETELHMAETQAWAG